MYCCEIVTHVISGGRTVPLSDNSTRCSCLSLLNQGSVMKSYRGVKGYLAKYLVLKEDLNLGCDLVLSLKQRAKLGLDTCFCTVTNSGRLCGDFWGGIGGEVVFFLAV